MNASALHERGAGSSPRPGAGAGRPLVESYRRLADVFHELLSEQSLDALLERIADALEELVPHDTLTIDEADEARGLLMTVPARDQYAAEIMSSISHFGRGITGWAVQQRQPVLAPQRTSINGCRSCPAPQRTSPRRS